MTKQPKSSLGGILGVCLLALMAVTAFGVAACLNPIGFSPELKFTVDANVSGDIDVYNVNNAVLWVVNMTKTVNVDLQTIEVVGGAQPAGYPMLYPAPAAKHSFASYHRPHAPREKNDTAPVQPYMYKVSLKMHDPLNSNAQVAKEIHKQMPMPKDYAVFLIRRADGTLDLVDEQPPASALDPNDTETNPPLPTGKPVFPLIVRNVTKNADIEYVNFGNYLSEAQPVFANMNDQKTFYMPADDYSPTYVSYRLKNTGTTGESVHNDVGPRVTIIDKDLSADSASWHLLFMYFYLAKDGTYKVTQQWPPAMNDVDDQGNIEGDYENARIRVLNTVASTAVTAILVKNPSAADSFYTVLSDNFQPSGVIGTGYNLNRDSKVALFNPLIANSKFGAQPGRFTGEPYDVWLKVDDTRPTSLNNFRIVKIKGRNLMVGETNVIILRDSDINESDTETVIIPATYTVTANGGDPNAPTTPAYTTTALTFTFDKDIAGIPAFTNTGTAVVGNLSGGPRVFTASVTTNTAPSESIALTCTTGAAVIDDTPHNVTVFKQVSGGGGPVTTYRYIYKDSGYTNAQPMARLATHNLAWFFEYEIRTYVDGVEDIPSRQTIHKDNYGYWLIDNTNNGGYVAFTQNITQATGIGTASLHVGPHPGTNQFYMSGDQIGQPTGLEWNFSTGLTFGRKINSLTGLNTGTDIVDGHAIENMPYQNVPLYAPVFGFFVTNLKVYGYPVTFTIRNP